MNKSMEELREKIIVWNEREACAKVAEAYMRRNWNFAKTTEAIAQEIAMSIRGRQYTEDF